MGLLKALAEPFKMPKVSGVNWDFKEKLRLFRKFLPYLRPWRKYGLLAGGCMFITVLLQLPLPLITRHVIDHVFPERNIHLLNWLVLGFGFLMLIRLTSGLLGSYFLTLFRQHTLLRIQLSLFQHVEHLSLSFHNNTKVGYLMSRIGNDPENLQGLLAGTFFNFIRDVLTFCVGVSIIFFLQWKLALVALMVLPFFIYAVQFFSEKVRGKSGEMQENIGRVFDVLGESLSGISVVKSFCAEKSQAKKLFEKFRTSFRSNLQYTMVNSVYISITALIAGLGPLIILAYGGREVMYGNLSLGSYVAFNAFVGYLYGPVRNLMGLNANVQTALASLKRVFEIFDLPTEDEDIDSSVSTGSLPTMNGEVYFQKVSFSYNGTQNALEQVSFKVEPGGKVALVGRSGAGKSTLVSLILKFYKPKSGAIYIDGTNIKNVRVKDLRRHIGIVLQDPFIFAGSVRENIKFGKSNATDEEIINAAKAANADRFIIKLPDKYETEVGERGVKLSGGERQRIAIARAMLKNPKILILDEATSEVDSESERFIQSALDKLLEGKTTFIIAHRLSTIRNVDRIFVIDEGKIKGEGKHEKLFKTSTLYRKLYEEQYAKKRLQNLG